MTTLEIVLICIIVWLVGVVVILWLDNLCEVDLKDVLIVFLWFIAIPFVKISYSLKHRKVPKDIKCKYDKDHAYILKFPLGWEKIIIYRNLYLFSGLDEKEDFTEEDVAEGLKNSYDLSKRKIRHLRKTKQITKITNKLKELYK